LSPDDPIRILLVEDSPYDVKLTLRALGEQLKNQVHVVRDGAEALDYLFSTGAYEGRSESAPPSVVLLDIKLPKIDGLEVLRRIREHPRTTSQPVVLLTSSAEHSDVVEAYRHHANSYVVKPANFAQFAQALKDLGLYWLIHNTPPPTPGPRS
jgi:two-component system response regulator